MRSQHGFTRCTAMTVQHSFSHRVQTTQAQESVAAVGLIHRHAAEQLAATLITAQRLEQAVASAVPLTPAQTVRLAQRKREFVWGLLTLVQLGGVRVINALKDSKPVLAVGVETQQHIDQLVQLYLQHIQTILRR
jgi:hypothetical protein